MSPASQVGGGHYHEPCADMCGLDKSSVTCLGERPMGGRVALSMTNFTRSLDLQLDQYCKQQENGARRLWSVFKLIGNF